MTTSVVIREARSAEDRAAAWRIREAVFIREQGVPEGEERDGLDDVAWHLLARDGAGRAIGTARILSLDARHRVVAPRNGVVAKIGRMAVVADKRRSGVGRMLLEAALEIARRHGYGHAELSAQETAVPFYEKSGFLTQGETYVEAGIPHRRMTRAL